MFFSTIYGCRLVLNHVRNNFTLLVIINSRSPFELMTDVGWRFNLHFALPGDVNKNGVGENEYSAKLCIVHYVFHFESLGYSQEMWTKQDFVLGSKFVLSASATIPYW